MKTKLVLFAFLVVCLVSLLCACGKASSTAPAPAASQAPAPQPSTTQAAAPQTLKIGVVFGLTTPAPVAWAKEYEVLVDMINARGGLDVGGQKYKLELIIYDSKNNQTTGTAAANRLIFEDKVKFLISDASSGVSAIVPIGEQNKVIVSCIGFTPDVLAATNKYTFSTSSLAGGTVIAGKWFTNKFPEKKKFTFVAADDQQGHMFAGMTVGTLKSLNFDISTEFFPASQTDLSSLGSKIKVSNPDVIITGDMPTIKPLRQAGWTGQFFIMLAYSQEQLLSYASAEFLEGYIGVSQPTEFDPPLTNMAGDFKKAYIAKYGKWESLDMAGMSLLDSLISAIPKAGTTTDTDKVAAVLSNGMTWEGVNGNFKMTPRPDFGNTRTVDSVCTFYMKQIKSGKAVLLDTVNIETAEKYFQDFLATAPPPGPPPDHK
jgi:branched-chain amino acid transport system substrate-binding protein